tara:strand:+ start:338 stop:532 length:195 start_codon:yes stop_codon:yes gene_type:complete
MTEYNALQTPAFEAAAQVTADRVPSTGNRLKFKLEMMLTMVMSDRTEEAGKLYEQLIEEFDKLA